MHILYRKTDTYHAINNPVIIPKGELDFSEKLMTTIIKTSYWYHKTNEEIPVMVKFKKVLMPFIEFI